MANKDYKITTKRRKARRVPKTVKSELSVPKSKLPKSEKVPSTKSGSAKAPKANVPSSKVPKTVTPKAKPFIGAKTGSPASRDALIKKLLKEKKGKK